MKMPNFVVTLAFGAACYLLGAMASGYDFEFSIKKTKENEEQETVFEIN